MHRNGQFFILVWAALLTLGTTVSRADDNCGKPDHPSTYRAQAGDVSTSTRLDLTRAFSGTGILELNVCNGELRVESSPDASRLRLSLSSPGADADLARYLQDLRVSDKEAVITIRVPGKYHPVITVSLPSSVHLHSEINLGAGTVLLYAADIAGDREANVGAGTARVLLDRDLNYATLEANVGMGKLEDDRPGGSHAYGVSSRSMEGQGKGSIKVNVGAGKLVLAPGPE